MLSKSITISILLIIFLTATILLSTGLVTGSQEPAAQTFLPIVANLKPLTIFLVKDINTQTPSSFIYCPTFLGNRMLCSAKDYEHSYELWKSNGQPGGASLLKDIQPGFKESYALHRHRPFAKLDSIVLFAADADQSDLWRTDGTKDGTVRIKSGFRTMESDNPFIVAGDLVYFLANDGTHGYELWRSDGTMNGTFYLKDMYESYSASIRQLTPLGDKLYFIADDIDSEGLWVTNGTRNGTKAVVAMPGGFIRNIAPLGDFLVVDRYDHTTRESALWRTDGTTAGTEQIFDFADSELSSTRKMTTLTSQVLFTTTYNDYHGWGIGVTDGTTTGTAFFDIGDEGYPHELTSAGTQAFFLRRRDDVGKDDLWLSDGTSAGTFKLASFKEVDSHSCPENFFTWDTSLFFTADDEVHGCELWTSDGTVAGTHLVKDIAAGQEGSWSTPGVVFRDWLYFSATDTLGDAELWRSDGTSTGTIRADDVNDYPSQSSNPRHLTAQPGGIYLSAKAGNDYGLWRSDGTKSGTTLVKNFGNAHGDNPLSYADWAMARKELYLINDGDLWRSNGTEAGTSELPGPEQCDYPYLLVSVGNKTFFFSESGWLCLAGSPSEKIKNIGGVKDAVAGDSILYFRTQDKIGASDGTPEGTKLFDEPKITMGDVKNMVAIGDTAYFSVGFSGSLWKLTGPDSSPQPVADSDYGPIGSKVNSLIAAYGELLYEAELSPYGPLLWRSNGTHEGTFPIAQLDICGYERVNSFAAALDGRVYFRAMDHIGGSNSEYGCELWSTDGTYQGTSIVKDMVPGPNHSYPSQITAAGRYIIFTADGQHGCHLWASDGTGPGTKRISGPGTGSAATASITSECPSQLTYSNGKLYFSAKYATGDQELWALLP